MLKTCRGRHSNGCGLSTDVSSCLTIPRLTSDLGFVALTRLSRYAPHDRGELLDRELDRQSMSWRYWIGQCQDRSPDCKRHDHGIGLAQRLPGIGGTEELLARGRLPPCHAARLQPRIRALEDWIGTPLFVRGAQGATLTPAGDFLRPLVDELLGRLHRLRRISGRWANTRWRRCRSQRPIRSHSTSFPAGFVGTSSRQAGQSQPDLGQHGSLRTDHAQWRGASPPLPLSRGSPDASAGRSLSERAGRQRRPGSCLRARHREPTGLAASWHTG